MQQDNKLTAITFTEENGDQVGVCVCVSVCVRLFILSGLSKENYAHT